ncbi:MAG: extracellular solute-binding protein [Spirochaetales bacterium]|nr:extracellular solute-binding protein [Spirochaetales bacterium]
MRQKILIGIALIVLAALFFVIRTPFSGEREIEGHVDAYFHLYASPTREVFEVLLSEFESFYPGIELEYHIEPYQDLKKTLISRLETGEGESAVVCVLTAEDLLRMAPGQENLSPWISSTWSIYYNEKRLSQLGYSREDLLALSDQGLEVFTRTFEDKVNEGETLFSLGADFYWPWLAWVQHLQLLDTGGKNPQAHGVQDWETGILLWEEMLSRDYFNPDYRSFNWAGSHLAISRGESLFVLSDASLYSTYLPSERSSINSVPFPGSVAQHWQVGSNLYLVSLSGVQEDDSNAEAAGILVDYLRSEGIQTRFLEQTGIRFLMENEDRKRKEIPSITQKTRDPAMQDLLKYLNR